MIILSATAYEVTINGRAYPKDTVSMIVAADGVSISFAYNGSYLFDNQVVDNIYLDGSPDVVFASVAALREWWELNALSIYAFSRPYKLVSAASTNFTLVKQGVGLLHSIIAVNKSSSDRYLKLYDLPDAPTAADIPVLTFLLPGLETVVVIEGEQIAGKPKASANLIPATLKFYNGIGLAITGGIADDDETAVVAGDVTVNIIYQ